MTRRMPDAFLGPRDDSPRQERHHGAAKDVFAVLAAVFEMRQQAGRSSTRSLSRKAARLSSGFIITVRSTFITISSGR